jgi:hypothetical protein
MRPMHSIGSIHEADFKAEEDETSNYREFETFVNASKEKGPMLGTSGTPSSFSGSTIPLLNPPSSSKAIR